MNCVCQGLKAHLQMSEFSFPILLIFCAPSFACYTEHVHSGKNKTSPFMSTPYLWILHRVPEAIHCMCVLLLCYKGQTDC